MADHHALVAQKAEHYRLETQAARRRLGVGFEHAARLQLLARSVGAINPVAPKLGADAQANADSVQKH